MDTDAIARLSVGIAIVAVTMTGVVFADRVIRLRFGHQTTIRFAEFAIGIVMVIGFNSVWWGTIPFCLGVGLVLLALRKVHNTGVEADRGA